MSDELDMVGRVSLEKDSLTDWYRFVAFLPCRPENLLTVAEMFRPHCKPTDYERLVASIKKEIASHDTVIQGDQSCS